MNFTYVNPTVIHFGKGEISSITKHLDKSLKIIVVYGGGSIKSNGVYEQVKNALEGYEWHEFGGIEPNPTKETLDKAIELIKEKKINFVLAVGGGSVIDGCKYIVQGSCYDGDAWDFYKNKTVAKEALPLGVILTLAATGSESNAGSVITKKQTHEKLVVTNPITQPKFAVLDPSIMASLSDKQLANGLVDAFVHICEQYVTHPIGSLVHDGYALALLKGLKILTDTWSDRKEYKWQENLMLIANQALNGFIGCGVPNDWATHYIGHELTAFYGIDHGRTLAIIQPQLYRVMIEEKKAKLEQLGANVFNIHGSIDDVIHAIENMYHSIGVSTNLNDYNVDMEVEDKVINSLKSHGIESLGENSSVTLDKIKQILKMCRK